MGKYTVRPVALWYEGVSNESTTAASIAASSASRAAATSGLDVGAEASEELAEVEEPGPVLAVLAVPQPGVGGVDVDLRVVLDVGGRRPS